MQFVGFDPGGERAFGWAVLGDSVGQLRLAGGGTCSSAPAALKQASNVLGAVPAAIGVDAPLFWATEGDRRADAYVRTMVSKAGGHASTVNHVNSLRGACLIQGILIARLAREKWPKAKLTEAHPKALLRVNAQARDLVASLAAQISGDHVRDAAVAAFAAYALIAQLDGWENLAAQDNAPHFPAAEAAYWFPSQST